MNKFSTKYCRLENISQTFLSLSATSYVLGIVIVNLYYGKYGFSSLSLFKVNYIIAGVWSLIVLAFFLFIIYTSLSYYKQSVNTQTKPLKRAGIIIFSIIEIIIFGSIGYYIAIILGFSMSIKWAWIPITGIIGLYITFDNIRVFINQMWKKDSDYTTNMLTGVLILTTYFVLFSHYLYETIPITLGGGKPQLVILSVQTNIKEQLYEDGFPLLTIYKDSSETNVSITNVSDTLLLLLARENNIVFISKKMPAKTFEIANEHIILKQFLQKEIDVK